jgi:hypothetical protein
VTVTDAAPTTAWAMKGVGYEFCNCQPGCTCNFSGYPSSSDGSCRALVVNRVSEGHCGDVDMAGVTCAAILDWPKAIHDGGGRAVHLVDPANTSQEQTECLAQICTGQLGGMPWEILGTTYSVAGLVQASILIEDAGVESTVTIDGVGTATGRTLRNPVTDEPHEAHIVLPEGFIWSDGLCGVGGFEAAAEGVSLSSQDSNWIHSDYDWHN